MSIILMRKPGPLEEKMYRLEVMANDTCKKWNDLPMQGPMFALRKSH